MDGSNEREFIGTVAADNFVYLNLLDLYIVRTKLDMS